MKRLGQILVGLLGLLVVGSALFAAYVLFDVNSGEQAADVTNTTIETADGTILAYLAEPSDEGTFPAVLMVHEWWGMNREITEMADRLAEQGYVVLAVDTYRGASASSVPGALYLRINVPQARVAQDVQAAFEWLAARENVDAERIGAIGFCYGGGVVMRHALDNPRLAAVINLYGDTIDEPTQFGALLENNSPVLGIFGREDAQIPLSEVQAFSQALAQTDIPHTVTVYDGVGHAFVNPDTIDHPERDNGAAADAWAQIGAFFAEHLVGGEA